MKYLALLVFLYCGFSQAVEITTADNLHIKADSTTADLKREIITYSGNVVVTKMSMSFKADSIEEHHKNKVLTKLVALGNPTLFINKLASQGALSQGTAKEITYIAAEKKVILKDYELKDAVGNTSSGSYGVYILDE